MTASARIGCQWLQIGRCSVTPGGARVSREDAVAVALARGETCDFGSPDELSLALLSLLPDRPSCWPPPRPPVFLSSHLSATHGGGGICSQQASGAVMKRQDAFSLPCLSSPFKRYWAELKAVRLPVASPLLRRCYPDAEEAVLMTEREEFMLT